MKKASIIAILLTFILLFSGCSLFYESGESYEGFYIYENKLGKDCYVGHYIWDGNKTDIVIPDEYNGKKVTRLGGYYGRGVPCSFVVEFPENFLEGYELVNTWYDKESLNKDNTQIVYLDFNLYIGENVREIEEIYLNDYNLYKSTDALDKQYTLYLQRFYVYCDANNKAFYSKDGKLYLKETDQLISEELGYNFSINYYDYEYHFGDKL